VPVVVEISAKTPLRTDCVGWVDPDELRAPEPGELFERLFSPGAHRARLHLIIAQGRIVLPLVVTEVRINIYEQTALDHPPADAPPPAVLTRQIPAIELLRADGPARYGVFDVTDYAVDP
jgi:hypothetical protein